MPASNKTETSDNFSNTLSNLRLNSIPQRSSNIASASDVMSTNSNELKLSNSISPYQLRSKFKTIKIFVVSNKNGM